MMAEVRMVYPGQCYIHLDNYYNLTHVAISMAALQNFHHCENVLKYHISPQSIRPTEASLLSAIQCNDARVHINGVKYEIRSLMSFQHRSAAK